MCVGDSVEREFSIRLEQVQTHGLGLSVDVYSPDLISLLGALRRRQVFPDYLEIFRSAPTALAAVKKQVGEGLLTYHGEGLWLTQPAAVDDPVFVQEVCETAEHLRTLGSAWLNHECATKYMAGYTYGTYLPPLYTDASARVVAENTMFVQDLLDRHCRLKNGGTPMVLLEMPPLTYFVAGAVSVPTFFRLITQEAACGLVLDIGHLWTVFRYSGAWRTGSLDRFVRAFLDEFPMHRVVEIHVAGLAVHESSLAVQSRFPRAEARMFPVAWVDAHAAPIPSVLFEILDQVLSHPRLTALRGLALEVDTKAIPLIVDEFSSFSCRYASVFSGAKSSVAAASDCEARSDTRRQVSASDRRALAEAYDRYARVVTGRAEPEGPEWGQPTACIDELDVYRSVYLPHEILSWGGEVCVMFPDTCKRLDERRVPLERFVTFWFSRPRPMVGPYDFFLAKIERFVEFVLEEAPELARAVEREADELRRAYDLASELPLQAAGECA